jgi:hypothetical protein
VGLSSDRLLMSECECSIRQVSYFILYTTTFRLTLAQAVTRRHLVLEVRAKSQASPCVLFLVERVGLRHVPHPHFGFHLSVSFH